MSKSSKKNPCIRCGAERIIAKTWTETVKTYSGESTITRTMMVCPDPDCQAKVEASFAANKVRLEDIQTKKLEFEHSSQQKKLYVPRKRVEALPL